MKKDFIHKGSGTVLAFIIEEKPLAELRERCDDGRCKLIRQGNQHLRHKIIQDRSLGRIVMIFGIMITAILTALYILTGSDVLASSSTWLTIAIGGMSIAFAKIFFEKQKTYDKRERHIQAAITYSNEKEWKLARESYEKILEIEPHNVLALNNAGTILMRFKKFEHAIPYFEKILDVEPNSLAALNNIGNCYSSMEKNDEAMESYCKALKIDENYLDAIYNIGCIYSDSMGKYSDAIGFFDKFIELAPSLPDGYTGKARALSRSQKYELALEQCDIALQINPAFAEALEEKSIILIKLERFDEVIACGIILLKINPLHLRQNPNEVRQKGPIHNLAIAYARLGQLEKARETIDQTLSINPGHADSWSLKGDLLYMLGKHERSIEAYNKSLKINPEQYKILRKKGLSFMELKRYNQAISCFDKAISLSNNTPSQTNNSNVKHSDIIKECHEKNIQIRTEEREEYVFIINSLMALERHDEAVKLSDQLLDKHPDDIDLQLLQVSIYQKTDIIKAREMMEQILKMKHKDVGILNKIGVTLSGLEQPDNALKIFNKTLQIDPSNITALENKAKILTELKFYERAITVGYDLILRIEPANAAAFYHKGRMLVELRRYNEALECFQNASEIDPENYRTMMAKGICLYELGRFDEAAGEYEKALELEPADMDTRDGLSRTYFRLGDYKKAWDIWRGR